MSARLRIELGAMLDQYDTARRAAELRQQSARDEEAGFLAAFAGLRRDVVRPLFEAAGEVLKDRGHGFIIREQEFAAEKDGARGAEAAIGIRITPAGMEGAAANDEHLRELSFTTRHYNRTVSITNGAVPDSGKVAGVNGARALAQIDARLVEEELLKLMAALVRV